MTAPHKNFAEVHGLRLAYAEAGGGDPIAFLHGNPTSSCVWRHVIPAVAHLGRCLAPDLLGMGDSDKLPGSGPGSYTLADHRRYLDGWFDTVGVTDHVTLVLHDWGSALGFDWARRHRAAIQAIAYMEAIVRPIGWQDFPPGSADLLRALRSRPAEILVQFGIRSGRPGGSAVLRDISGLGVRSFKTYAGEHGLTIFDDGGYEGCEVEPGLGDEAVQEAGPVLQRPSAQLGIRWTNRQPRSFPGPAKSPAA